MPYFFLSSQDKRPIKKKFSVYPGLETKAYVFEKYEDMFDKIQTYLDYYLVQRADSGTFF